MFEGELVGDPVVFAFPNLLLEPEDDADFCFRNSLHFGVLNSKNLINAVNLRTRKNVIKEMLLLLPYGTYYS